MQVLLAASLMQTSLLLAQTAPQEPRAASPSQPACIRAGCNGELCIRRSELGDVDSICVSLPPGEEACYKAAVCKPSNDTNGCAWADKRALETCLSKARANHRRRG